MIEAHDAELLERSLRHATSTHTGAALDTALAKLGWQDALSVDVRTAVALLFGLQGESNATSSALDHVLAAAMGSHRGAVVLPAVGQWTAPGALAGERLEVHGLAMARLGESERALIVARSGDSYVAVEVDTASLPRRPIEGIDPSLGLIAVDGAPRRWRELGPVDWGTAALHGQLALAHELVGASRGMLELARQHALDRIQFGHPIARFQAIRHRLADTLVAIEAADAVIESAWMDQSPQSAAMAKATAGRSARVAARHCQQVLAGIGFTTEHPLHRYVRRILVLEQLLGSTRHLTRALGEEILERGQLPPLLPL